MRRLPSSASSSSFSSGGGGRFESGPASSSGFEWEWCSGVSSLLRFAIERPPLVAVACPPLRQGGGGGACPVFALVPEEETEAEAPGTGGPSSPSLRSIPPTTWGGGGASWPASFPVSRPRRPGNALWCSPRAPVRRRPIVWAGASGTEKEEGEEAGTIEDEGECHNEEEAVHAACATATSVSFSFSFCAFAATPFSRSPLRPTFPTAVEQDPMET